MSFPVNGEIWVLFEGILKAKAKVLVEDIAKRQGADPKELWNKVHPIIKIAPIDTDLPDPNPILCPFYIGKVSDGSCIAERCRQPCLLGFDRCRDHIHKQEPHAAAENPVKRVFDFNSKHYFVDSHGVAYDKGGTPMGTVEDGELKLFEC
jgi:hypothetical protein